MIYKNRIMFMSHEIIKGSNQENKRIALERAIEQAELWSRVVHNDMPITRSNRKALRRSCHNFLQDNTDFPAKPVGFLSGFLWSFFLNMLIKWVVEKILEQMLGGE